MSLFIGIFQYLQPFKYQPHKMGKHTQTLGWKIADELFGCVWSFCGFGA